MESVVAKSAPTSTAAPRAKSTPFGLLRKIWPFAVSRPKISDGLLPRTRFSAIAEELGWLKFTQAPEPIEKLCQLRIAEFELCVICRFDPELEMLAEPAVTVAPVGSVLGATSAYAGLRKLHGSKAAPTARAITRSWARNRRSLPA